MWVLGDRTQAPSGAGYALENRTVMTRVLGQMFNDGKIRRLSSFFRQFQNSLNQLAAPHDSPSVVVLTPGPFNETYFEHAYLASYLSYSLVQGSDLTVRDGQTWLKTIEGLRPVDVILRRVDDSFCDPLELRSYSQLGVAGLLESVRRQKTAVANPLGSGVLENPGLMPFMPNLARYFLGEDLILPTAATWWCGQPQELEHVLQNLPNLVIKRIARTANSKTIFGNLLSQNELEALRDQIRKRPFLYVGQEQVSFSTSPALVNDHSGSTAHHFAQFCRLQPRRIRSHARRLNPQCRRIQQRHRFRAGRWHQPRHMGTHEQTANPYEPLAAIRPAAAHLRA